MKWELEEGLKKKNQAILKAKALKEENEKKEAELAERERALKERFLQHDREAKLEGGSG